MAGINLFYASDEPLHQAVVATFADALEVVYTREALDEALAAHASGLVILDAQYGPVSGYAICEAIKARYGAKWRVHVISNESSVGEAEKAAYAHVDRLFIVPLELGELMENE